MKNAEQIKSLAAQLLEAEARKLAIWEEIESLRIQIEKINNENTSEDQPYPPHTLFFQIGEKVYQLEFDEESRKFYRLSDTEGSFI